MLSIAGEFSEHNSNQQQVQIEKQALPKKSKPPTKSARSVYQKFIDPPSPPFIQFFRFHSSHSIAHKSYGKNRTFVRQFRTRKMGFELHVSTPDPANQMRIKPSQPAAKPTVQKRFNRAPHLLTSELPIQNIHTDIRTQHPPDSTTFRTTTREGTRTKRSLSSLIESPWKKGRESYL